MSEAIYLLRAMMESAPARICATMQARGREIDDQDIRVSFPGIGGEEPASHPLARGVKEAAISSAHPKRT